MKVHELKITWDGIREKKLKNGKFRSDSIVCEGSWPTETVLC